MTCMYLSLLFLAPCTAENVAANVDCYNNTAEVSWRQARGAESYVVTAVGEDGHWVSCETAEHQCVLERLQCGQRYNVSLTTISGHCQTETHTNVTFCTRKSNTVFVCE